MFNQFILVENKITFRDVHCTLYSEAFLVFYFKFIFCRDWRKTLLNPSHIANDDLEVK